MKLIYRCIFYLGPLFQWSLLFICTSLLFKRKLTFLSPLPLESWFESSCLFLPSFFCILLHILRKFFTTSTIFSPKKILNSRSKAFCKRRGGRIWTADLPHLDRCSRPLDRRDAPYSCISWLLGNLYLCLYFQAFCSKIILFYLCFVLFTQLVIYNQESCNDFFTSTKMVMPFHLKT